MGKRRRAPVLLNEEQMEKLSTPRLLAYRNRLLTVPEGPNWEESDYSRQNKQNPKWQECYSQCIAILSRRGDQK